MTILSELPTNEPDIDVTTPDPGFGAKFNAAWRSETIRTDAWHYADRVRAGLRDEIYDRLPFEGKNRVFDHNARHHQDTVGLDRILMDEAGKARAAGDLKWQDLPASIEDLDHEVDRRRKAELDEAEDLLAIDGGGLAGFLGTGGRAMTDPTSLMMMPFGAGGSLARVVISEAVLGAAGEAAVLPREFQVADELGLEKPNVAKRIGIGALFGGGLAGAFSGTGRLLTYGKQRRAALAEARPRDANELDFGEEVNAEYERLATDAQPDFPIGKPVQPDGSDSAQPLGMSGFDFSPTGNASPRTNRIGYVFGRLLALGYQPHIAAGLTGNMMVESGVALNTRAVGDNGNAFGMGQWNGPRRHAYLAFAQKRGKDPGDLDTQIAFLDYELKTSESPAAAQILAATDARQAAAIASQQFWRPSEPHLQQRVAYAATLMQQFDQGAVPKWQGAVSPAGEGATSFTGYGTSRGYTGTGQILAGDDLRIDVEYQVVDLADLRQASGDLQPRDRGRVASDAWVSDTAARLDPAQLMPSPTADRGAPLVGSDGVIESGNGRVRAIERAYGQHPDRAEAYRRQIELTTGKSIPEAMERPVLIARRQTDLDAAARRQMVVDAQDSGVARMNASERAQVGQRALTADLMAKYQAGYKFSAAENRDFARGFSGAFPRSERNAFIGQDGGLSIDGARQLSDAMFARAYEAPDILSRYVETEAGDLRSLMDALSDAAPHIAQLRAEIEAGLIRPEMDITPFLLDAARLIMTARDLAAREGSQAAKILEELLADVDLLDGVVAPLTQALVRKMMPKGKQAPAAKIAGFLKRYVDEARKAGRAGDALLDPPGPLDVLKAIDRDVFGDLVEVGTARIHAAPELQIDPETIPDSAFAEGARSPEAQAADDLAEVQFRAELTQSAARARGRLVSRIETYDRWIIDLLKAANLERSDVALKIKAAIEVFRKERTSTVGKGPKKKLKLQIRDAENDLKEVLNITAVDETVDTKKLREEVSKLRFQLNDLMMDQDSFSKSQPVGKLPQPPAVPEQFARSPDITIEFEGRPTTIRSSDDLAPTKLSEPSEAPPAAQSEVNNEIRKAAEAFQTDGLDLDIELPDGTSVSLREILDDLDADEVAETVIDACTLGGTS